MDSIRGALRQTAVVEPQKVPTGLGDGTTNRRVWEHDEDLKKYLRRIRCMAIDMETATIFITGFANEIPTGALLLVSDQPMVPEGVKTTANDQRVTAEFAEPHLRIGIDSLCQLINQGVTVKHLRF